MLKGEACAYVRRGGTWRKLLQETPEPPEPFNTCWTHPDVGELFIGWVWRRASKDAWIPCAVRAAIQPTIFATVGEVGVLYGQALREIGAMLKRDALDVPVELACKVIGSQT